MILGVVFWAHISEKKEYRELITMGISIWKRRITRRLESSYRLAITVSPGLPRPYIQLAVSSAETEEYSQAVEVLNQGLRQ